MLAELAPLQVVAWICTYLVHSTLLLTLAWALTRRAQRLSLPAREGIWKLAVAGGFLTATLQLALALEPPLLHLALQREPETAVLDTAPTAAPERAAPEPSAETLELAEQAESAPLAAAASPLGAEIASEVEHRESSAELFHATSLISEPAGEVKPASDAFASFGAHEFADQAGEPAFQTAFLSPLPLSIASLLDASLRVASSITTDGAAAEAPSHATAPALESEPAPEQAKSSTPLAAIVPAEWSLAALLAWSVAGLACALGLTLGMRRLRSDLRGRTELAGGPAFDDLVHLALRAGLRRRVRLYVAPGLAAPLSMGWLRPAVCVPPRALEDLADDERRAMLAHEVAHLARRDPIWHLGLWLCETACFFQPLNRLARRELGATFELAADAWAARATGERLALASCLARIAGWIVGDARGADHRAWSAALTEGVDPQRLRSRLGQRIERLLDERALAEPPRRRGLELALSAALLAGLALFAPGAAAARTHAAPEPQFVRPAESALPFEPQATPLSPELEAATAALERLDLEMTSLEGELAVLRQELGDSELGSRLDALLGEVEARLERLGERRARIRHLLEAARAITPAQPTPGPSIP